MRLQTTVRSASLLATVMAATAILSGQTPPAQTKDTVFRTTTNFVTTDVIPRDKDGKFIPDLSINEFKVYEDGVQQKIEIFRPIVGGRPLLTVLPTTVASAPREGLILPPTRPQTDTSGRIFIIFIDEKHFTALETPKVKYVLTLIRDNLIHDNDLVGFVSTGSTAIAIDPSYDYEHRKFNDVIDRVVGSAPKPDDYINEAWFEGQQGPPGLRQAASQAFGTAYDMIEQLSKIVDRRKAFIYVSDGYTFDPFTDARFQNIERQYEEYSGQADQPQRNNAGQIVDSNGQVIDPQMSDTPPPPKQSELTPDNPLADARYRERTMWKESELIAEEADLTRTANRANVTFYTIDPRGLITGMDAGMSNKIEYPDLRRFIDTQANSLKVLAEETGGLAIVGMNDFVKWIQRIDAETSDSYTIGYQSTNPDPLKVKRTIKIEVTRPTVATLLYRHDYTIQKTSRK